MKTEIPFRPLGLIKEFFEQNGFSVAHCYEDLVFMEHNSFLLRMEDKGEEVSLVFNAECDPVKGEEIPRALFAGGLEIVLQITQKGTYTLTQNEEDNTINIEFSDLPERSCHQ